MSVSTSLSNSLNSGLRIDTPVLQTSRTQPKSGVRRANSLGDCRSSRTTPRRGYAPGRNPALIGAFATQALEESFGDIADQKVRSVLSNLEASLTQRFLDLEIRLTRTQSMICDGIGPDDPLPDMSLVEQIELWEGRMEEVRLCAQSAEDRCSRLEALVTEDSARQELRLEEMLAIVRGTAPDQDMYAQAVKEVNTAFMADSGRQMLEQMKEMQDVVASIRHEIPSHDVLLKMQEEHAAAIHSDMASREALAKMSEESAGRTMVVELQEEIASIGRTQVREAELVAKLHQDVEALRTDAYANGGVAQLNQDVQELFNLLKSHIMETHGGEEVVKVNVSNDDAIQDNSETTQQGRSNSILSILSSTTDVTKIGHLLSFKEEMAAAVSTHVMELERAAAKARAQILDDQVKATVALNECLEALPSNLLRPTTASGSLDDRTGASDRSILVETAMQLCRLLGGCARECVWATLSALPGPPSPVRTPAQSPSSSNRAGSTAIELTHSSPRAASQ